MFDVIWNEILFNGDIGWHCCLERLRIVHSTLNRTHLQLSTTPISSTDQQIGLLPLSTLTFPTPALVEAWPYLPALLIALHSLRAGPEPQGLAIPSAEVPLQSVSSVQCASLYESSFAAVSRRSHLVPHSSIVAVEGSARASSASL